METLVSRNRNLVWDGWDVIKTTKSPTGFFYKDGMRIKGQWYRTERLNLTRQGWVIPDEFIKA